MMYCKHCGQEIANENAAVCVNCGCKIEHDNGDNNLDKPAKSKILAVVLALFLGEIGIHRFYLGYTASGVVMIILSLCGFLTLGITTIICVVWAIIDLVRIAFGNLKDANGRALS